MDVKLVAGMGMNPLPLARFYDEALHHQAVVVEQRLAGDVWIVHIAFGSFGTALPAF
jgi:hypothetical protein